MNLYTSGWNFGVQLDHSNGWDSDGSTQRSRCPASFSGTHPKTMGKNMEKHSLAMLSNGKTQKNYG